MKRFFATVITDCRLQHRNGFYYAVAFVLVIFTILVSQLPRLNWAPWLPVILLGNLALATFYFVGGLVLLEKGEGTLEAQVVSPLRIREYLGAKVATLTVLSVVENMTMVTIVQGFKYTLVPLVAGIIAASVIYILLGFVTVVRYDSINEYLMPSAAFFVALCLPYLDFFGIWTSWFMFLHPLQGPLVLMQAAFEPVDAARVVAAVLSISFWSVVMFVLSHRAYHRFVVRKEGTH